MPDPFSNFQFGGSNYNGSGASPNNSPYPDRRLPSWMPTMNAMTGELQDQYGRVNAAFNTSDYDKASTETQANILTTGLNAGGNAATAYANKARQAGGSGLGAGLVKAEGAVAGRRASGDIALEQAKYDIQQREGAATQAAQIAGQLGDLRNRYLSSLVGYATSEDATAAAHPSSGRAGGVDMLSPSEQIGGLPSSSSSMAFNNYTDYAAYLQYLHKNYGG